MLHQKKESFVDENEKLPLTSCPQHNRNLILWVCTHTRKPTHTHADPHTGVNIALPDVWHFIACNGAKKISAGLY